MEKQLVAYLGIPGSFTHSAAKSYFSSEQELQSYPNFKKIFKAVESRLCQYGVVPLENSLAGSIYENYDLLRNSPVSIIGEAYVRVEHHLCVYSSSEEITAKQCDSITDVFSHPKALEQISNFLANNPNIKTNATSDTASAAQYISEAKNSSYAAICSRSAATIYGLTILAENLEDDRQNFTRFAVLSTSPTADLSANKCSLLFILPHIPKSLFKALEIIVSSTVNTTKIESRPIPGKPFEYVFYLDFEFEPSARTEIDAMLSRFKSLVSELKILGFYSKSSF